VSSHSWWSVIYSISQIIGGLLLHPYQTMQSLVRDRVFVWMSLLPMAVLAITTVVWRFGVVPLVQLIFSCAASGLWLCNWLSFLSNWLTFFCLFWQILLLYLLFRFTVAFKKSV